MGVNPSADQTLTTSHQNWLTNKQSEERRVDVFNDKACPCQLLGLLVGKKSASPSCCAVCWRKVGTGVNTPARADGA